MRTNYTIYDVAEKGIPTIPFEQYFDEGQLEEGKSYLIGVMEFGEFKDTKICHDNESQLAQVVKLQRMYGEDAEIVIQEHAVGKVLCVFEITQLSMRVEGDVTEEEMETLHEWKRILLEDFDYTKALVGIVVRDNSGEMVLKSIH